MKHGWATFLTAWVEPHNKHEGLRLTDLGVRFTRRGDDRFDEILGNLVWNLLVGVSKRFLAEGNGIFVLREIAATLRAVCFRHAELPHAWGCCLQRKNRSCDGHVGMAAGPIRPYGPGPK